MQGVNSAYTPSGAEASEADPGAGTHEVNITMEGGSGKAHIESPVSITESDGKITATLIWSSDKYDYVIVDGVKYENENPGGSSTFTVPVRSLDEPLELIGDTLAMSKPHEIEYRIIWGSTSDASDGSAGDTSGEETADDNGFGIRPAGFDDLTIGGMKPDGKLELEHAQGFDVLYYGNCRLIRIYGSGDFLLVPEKEQPPEGLPEDITVIKQPVGCSYIASTSVMDLIRQIGAMDCVKLAGLDANDWSVEEAADRIRDARMVYAGKYRSPDYELILSAGCDLAVENTMIYHDPQVKEKLEDLGIPVMVETSSYESDPLGRLEWIKLYGVLFGREKAADEYYSGAKNRIMGVSESPNSDLSVAVFYVTATGMINVRMPGDYITKMIEMAGGVYVPDSDTVKNRTGMGTLNMQAEDFYAAAADADVLIYNGTIDGDVDSVEDIAAKGAIFSKFRAVQDGKVYLLRGDFFQQPTAMADLIVDVHDILSGEDEDLTFLTKLNDK